MGAAVFAGAVVLVGFEWKPLAVLWGTGVGIAVFGVATWIGEVAAQVPRSRYVVELPGDVELDRPYRLRPLWLLVVLAICVGGTWLADRWDLGAAFVPGQLAGSAAAYFLGAALVARWEWVHGKRVITSERRHRDETEVFAQQRPPVGG
jgi:hypothetical protein